MSFGQYIVNQFKACHEFKRRYLTFLLFSAAFLLTFALWAPLVAPFLPIGSRTLRTLDFFSLSELGSLALSFLSCLYYFFLYKSLPDTSANSVARLARFVALFFHFFAVGFVVRHDAIGLVGCVLGVASSFCLLDYAVGLEHPEASQRDEYFTSFVLADLPAVSGLIYLWMATALRSGVDPGWMVFVTGASALHLLLCNVTFFVVQLGLHRYAPPDPAKSSQSPASIRPADEPEGGFDGKHERANPANA